MAISIHALREEGDTLSLGSLKAPNHISIHALREEGDLSVMGEKSHLSEFLSTPSARRATHAVIITTADYIQFLSTPSARRATTPKRAELSTPTISIHALREEGDCCPLHRSGRAGNFYPRPPRGGRRAAEKPAILHNKFLSTPSARRATVPASTAPAPVSVFLSTPSARRATISLAQSDHASVISIHALREEGDLYLPV